MFCFFFFFFCMRRECILLRGRANGWVYIKYGCAEVDACRTIGSTTTSPKHFFVHSVVAFSALRKNQCIGCLELRVCAFSSK
uniref:Putative secreted protein n=1 Tax=Rhipicephalus microplus TaxID=6941 RepID=A0A6M2DAR7_RHIMP